MKNKDLIEFLSLLPSDFTIKLKGDYHQGLTKLDAPETLDVDEIEIDKPNKTIYFLV